MPDDRILQHDGVVRVEALKASDQRRVQLVSILWLVLCLPQTTFKLFYVRQLLCGRRLRDGAVLKSL